MAGRQDYEERKQARIDRLETAAEKASRGSMEAFSKGHNLTKDIPLGQPNIRGALTGVMNKARNAMDKSCALSDKANYYAEKAQAAENNTAISSDDPNCIEKLEEKIETLKIKQEYAKAINAHYRKNGTCKGFRDITEERAEKLDKSIKESYSWEQRPFPSYELTSINSKIKAAQTRIEQIKRIDAMPDEIIKYDLCEIESSTETNRVAITFHERAPETLINELKSNGFKWAYSEGKWQRLRSPYSLRLAKRIVEDYLGGNKNA